MTNSDTSMTISDTQAGMTVSGSGNRSGSSSGSSSGTGGVARYGAYPWRDIVPFAVLGTLLSLFFTGFRFGINNNVFHIAYVLDWASLPAFADDPYYHTLKYFTSFVWPPLRLIATESNLYALFLAAFIVSRLCALLAVACLLSDMGLHERRYLLLGVLAAAATPWLRGYSALGWHGLFIDYFTQSECTWPLVIGAVLGTARRKPAWTAVFTAATLSVNAFIGIWLLLILPVCLFFYRPRPAFAALLRAGLIFALLSLPIAIWILGALAAPHPPLVFPFSAFIRAYFPYHFLIGSVGRPEITQFACIAVAGLLACGALPNKGFWRLLLAAGLGVLAVGALLPYVVDHKLIFDLHFLRLGGVIQFFCVVAVIASSLLRMRQADERSGWVVPLVMLALTFSATYGSMLLIALLSLCFPLAAWLDQRGAHRAIRTLAPALRTLPRPHRDDYQMLLGLGLLLLWAAAYVLKPQHSPLGVAYALLVAAAAAVLVRVKGPLDRNVLAAALVLAGVAVAAETRTVERRALAQQDQQVDAQGALPMARWLRAHPIHGQLLLSPEAMQEDTFSLVAKTPVWADFKQGAAVLWYPAFYGQWSQRYTAALKLATLPQQLAYARAQHIPYLVGRNIGQGCPAGSLLVHEEGRFVLCAATP